MAAADFIAVYDDMLPAATCAQLVARFAASDEATPGRVGGGVLPELKRSEDIGISGKPAWHDAEAALNAAMYRGLLAYLRTYRYAMLAPLRLQVRSSDGVLRALVADDFDRLDDAALGAIVRDVLRPGTINLQRYRADTGGYPYWHCELYPRDADAETLHRVLLWTLYLNDGFADGETEFLYQQRKIVPKAGRLLIAPTAFTHTHRGNVARGGEKFIATSWVLFQRAERLFGNRG